jgi:hypothetical protein
MTRIAQRAGVRRIRCVHALSVVFLSSLSTIAGAEVHVEGSPAAVRVTTSRDTISDVLLALAATFNVQYRATIPLDAAADATYSGSLEQVISRMLGSYTYVIKTDNSKVTEVVVYGKRGEVVIPPKVPTDKSNLPQGR